MSVLINKQTKLLVQGITGSQGMLHTRGCRDYGTNVDAGVTPGKGGQYFEDVKIYNTELHNRFWASLKDQKAVKIIRHKLKFNISNSFLLKNKKLI